MLKGFVKSALKFCTTKIWKKEKKELKNIKNLEKRNLSRVYTSCLRLRFMHCIAFWKYLHCSFMSMETNLRTSNMQCNVDNARTNGMWQHGFKRRVSCLMKICGLKKKNLKLLWFVLFLFAEIKLLCSGSVVGFSVYVWESKV